MPRLLIATTIARTIRAFLVPYADYFRASGWEVDALAHGISSDSSAASFDSAHEIHWTRRPTDLHHALGAVRRVQKIVEDGKYDIVHVHTPIAAFVTRSALRSRARSTTKVIYTAHGFHFHRGGGRLRNAMFVGAERLAGRWTDYLIVINEEDHHAARRLHLVPEDRLCYMPGIGVNTAALDPARVTPAQTASVRKELGLSPNDALFLIVGELSARKRQEDAIRALSLLTKLDAHLALAGAGPREMALRSLSRKLNLNDRVHFLGERADVPALMRASLATVLPSDREGLPRALLESLSLAVPAIGSDARGVGDVLANGCGIVVPVGDVRALARAMEHLMNHPGEAALMASRGRQRARTEYDVGKLVHQHEALYERALHTSARR